MALEEGQAAPTRTDDAKFGETPLAQTVAAAAAMRRLSSLLLSLEQPHPTVDAMLAKFDEWESELAPAAPRDNAPRIGELDNDPRRVYLNHATNIGAYNPSFPEYSFDYLDADKAAGRVVSRWSTKDRRDWYTAVFSRCFSTASSSTTVASWGCPARRGRLPCPSGGPRRC
jgi:hypothetical protein